MFYEKSLQTRCTECYFCTSVFHSVKTKKKCPSCVKWHIQCCVSLCSGAPKSKIQLTEHLQCDYCTVEVCACVCEFELKRPTKQDQATKSSPVLYEEHKAIGWKYEEQDENHWK